MTQPEQQRPQTVAEKTIERMAGQLGLQTAQATIAQVAHEEEVASLRARIAELEQKADGDGAQPPAG